MDPITFTAIVAALGVIAEGAGRAVGQNLATDAYEKLKTILKRKFGDDSEVVKAVDTVEEDPKSDWRQGMLKEKLEGAGADQDPEVRQAAQELLDRVKERPGGEKHVQIIRGNYNAMADRSSTARVNVNQPKDNLNQPKD
jgi:hypothetical protein